MTSRLGVLTVFVGFLGCFAFALPGPIQVRPGKVSSPFQGGDVIGGEAGVEYSLIGIGNEKIAGGERLVLSYGDRNGKALDGAPGYFHLSLDREARRLVIDLAQVSKTAVDPMQLEKILSHSKLVASSEMTMDPNDGSTNITLLLKTPITAKVAVSTDKRARVIVEMRTGAAREAGIK